MPREDGDTYLRAQNYQHPILKPFASFATRMPWSKFPVFRYWLIDELASDAGTVIAYNDGRPALLERTIRSGQAAGHVLMTSTPFSDLVSRRDAWNWLPNSGQMRGWPFVILANEIVSYLVGSGEQRLNYFAGGNAVTLSLEDVAQNRPANSANAAASMANDSSPRRYVLRDRMGLTCLFHRPKKANYRSVRPSRWETTKCRAWASLPSRIGVLASTCRPRRHSLRG